MPGSRPFRALDHARFIIYTCYDEIFINQARAFPPVRKGALLLRVILCAMPYRKVTYTEQMFYILRYWIKDRVSRYRGSGCRVKPWAEAFYKGDAWQSCRAAFLASKGYLCERCSTPDDPVVAKIAHHKVYLNERNVHDPKIALSFENLEALCQDCHNREHHKKPKKRYSFDESGNIIPR